MISKYLSEAWIGIAPAMADHLWQSTLVLLAAWALTLPLRQHQARARYWLWFVASLKFLVPFSLLVDLGLNLGARLGVSGSAAQASAAAPSGFSLVMDYVGRHSMAAWSSTAIRFRERW